MLVLETGNPSGALVYFLLYTTVGVVVGAVLFAVCAYPGARRPQFRQWGTMPRTGAVVGLLIAGGLTYLAWSQMYRGFYQVAIDGDIVHLEFRMPTQEVTFPLADVVAFEEKHTFDKGGSKRLVVRTASGEYVSAPMYRSRFKEVWDALGPYRP
jgi:hypothetical protein